jgi:hypothetical protein
MDSRAGDLESLLADFKKHHRSNSARETRFFRTMPSMGLAIYHVAMAVDGNDRCFDHQFHITQPARRKAKQVLQQIEAQMQACRSFHALHSLFLHHLTPVRGLGEMYIYDAALRMGAYLRLYPFYIYLHRGTRVGAKALGLVVNRPYLERTELPKDLQVLSADNIETFLCMYRNQLSVHAPAHKQSSKQELRRSSHHSTPGSMKKSIVID